MKAGAKSGRHETSYSTKSLDGYKNVKGCKGIVMTSYKLSIVLHFHLLLTLYFQIGIILDIHPRRRQSLAPYWGLYREDSFSN
jgi:hypothetical protein